MIKFFFPPAHVVSRAQMVVLAAFFGLMVTFIMGCTTRLGWEPPSVEGAKMVVAVLTTPAPTAPAIAAKAPPATVSPKQFVRSHERMERAFRWLTKTPAGREALRRHYATYGQLELVVPITTVAENGAMATTLVRKHQDLFRRLHAAGITNTAALTRALAQNHLNYLAELQTQFGSALAINRPNHLASGKLVGAGPISRRREE